MKKMIQKSIVLSFNSASSLLASLVYLFSILLSGDLCFSKKETIIKATIFIILLSVAILIISRDTKRNRENEKTKKLIDEIGK